MRCRASCRSSRPTRRPAERASFHGRGNGTSTGGGARAPPPVLSSGPVRKAERYRERSTWWRGMATPALIVGTRGSALALWQAERVAGEVRRYHPQLVVEIQRVSSPGDRMVDVPLAQI